MHLLQAPRVVEPTAGHSVIRSPGWVLIDGDRVGATGGGDRPAAGESGADAPATRLPDGVLAPGLVDAQLNGAFGVDFAAADDEGWAVVLRRLPETGVTATVPTLITAPLEELTAGLRAFTARRPRLDRQPGTARALGIHVEGPFLAERRRGAHRAELLCDPTSDRVDALLEAGDGGALSYLTLAPEREHAFDAVRRLVAAGVRVAVGHTDATDDVVTAAADAGATLVTHLFNAQRPLRHRDPGTVGAALTDPRLTLGLIVDLHHVDPTAVRVTFGAAAGRVMLVTDSVAAMGMPPGTYELGGQVLEVVPGRPPLREDGTIAGAAVRLDEALANTVACGVDLATAVDAATRVPADALGREDLGRLAPGALADLVWLTDDLRTRATWVGGRLAWCSSDAAVTGADLRLNVATPGRDDDVREVRA
ncbi:MAG TPA: N-acetylglucosamine-6-phosphate deacetylase [Jiangellales bacterium]|nr:N-acetylglucosamine-6-phosphate deacetylase [Jiangellales bacterium]